MTFFSPATKSRTRTPMDLDTEPSRRVALLDDNPAVRESVSMLLKSVGLETVAFHSPAVFLASAIEDTGCILLDIRMPEMSGLEVHRRLRERGIETPVIFLTGHGDVSMAVRSMREGAFDFLEKPMEDQQLIDRVLEALTHDTERRASAARRSDSASRISRLTAREREIAELIADGQSSREVAAVLSLSVRTVEGYRSRIMAKLEVDSLAQVVRALMQ